MHSETSAGLLIDAPLDDGALGGIRTPDPQIRSLVLYPAELRAPESFVTKSAVEFHLRFARPRVTPRSRGKSIALPAERIDARIRKHLRRCSHPKVCDRACGWRGARAML